MNALTAVWDFIKEYWELFALGTTWVGIVMVYIRRRQQWRRKTFMRQVNFSLNYVDGQTLMLRTLLEDTALRVWLNEYGVGLVVAAAAKTTEAQPFIPIDSESDLNYIQRAVLNVLSEKFASVYVARSLGAPVKMEEYLFGITCEKYGRMRTQKIRVIIIRERDLKSLFATDRAAEIKFVSTVHEDRFKTLKVMYWLHANNDESKSRMIGKVELGVQMTDDVEPTLP